MGRHPKLSAERQAAAVDEHLEGSVTVTELAARYGVIKKTMVSYLTQAGALARRPIRHGPPAGHPRPNKLPPEQVARIVRDYANGMSSRALAAREGVSDETILKYVRQAGKSRTHREAQQLYLQRRPPKPAKPAKEKRYSVADLLTWQEWNIAYWSEPISCTELGRRLGVSAMCIHRTLTFHAIPLRTISETAQIQARRRWKTKQNAIPTNNHDDGG